MPDGAPRGNPNVMKSSRSTPRSHAITCRMKHDDETINMGRRRFLRNTSAAAAGVAASTMMPVGAAGMLEALVPASKAATGLTLGGIRFEMAANALLEDMFLPSEQLSNLRAFFSAAPTAHDAYEFARNFGSPKMLESNMRNMLDFVNDTARELDAAKALNPDGVSNFLNQMHRREIYEQFHHIMPDSSGSELVEQLRTTIGQDAHAYSQTQQSIVHNVHDTYERLRTQFAGFQTELNAGEADYARDVAEQSQYYSDMASARKAGGYPIPDHCKTRPESYVGTYEQSGAQLQYLGRLTPHGHIDITKG